MSGPWLHVIASARGGGAVQMMSLAAAQSALGHAVRIAMPRDAPAETPALIAAEALGLHPLDAARLGGLPAVGAALRTERPALVHAHGLRAAVLTAAALLARADRSTPLVYSVHGYVTPWKTGARRALQGWAERQTAGRSCAVIAAAEAERQALLGGHVASEAKIHTVLPGLALSAFSSADRATGARVRASLGVSSDAFVVLCACRLDRPRDLPTLQAGFRALRAERPDAVLCLAGDGPLRSAVERGPGVLALGFRPDVAELLAAADVFALTSTGWEGLPTGVVEAQAAGVAVVATDAGGTGEALQHGRTGLLVPRGAPEALGRALVCLAMDPERRRTMGAAGREHARRFSSAERMAREVVAVYPPEAGGR